MNTGKVDVLLGLQWGDEGKGKVVDVLTPNYDVVARFQGGPNAGHTLEFEGQKYVLRSIPSGIFQGGKVNIIGNGVVLAPDLFMAEAKELEKSGHDLTTRLHISKKAHLIMPTHRVLDRALEAAKGKSKVGTTGKGIGPTYTDKVSRNGLRVGDIFENFEQKYAELEKQYTAKCAEFDEKCASLTASEEACAAAEEKCAGLQAELDGKCAELDAKCADYDAKCAELDAKYAELEEKCAKLGEYEKKEVCAKNMASIDKYAKCFSDEKVAELKKLAETCTCEEMDNAIAKCAMEFAELAAQNEFKFSYGFPGVNAGFTATDSNDSDLAKIAKKYNTIVR